MEEARAIVPDELLQKLADLNLPWLCNHKASRERLLNHLALLVVEIVLACTREDSTTETIGEGLVALPSPKVRSIMASNVFEPDIVADFEGVPDNCSRVCCCH